MTFLQQLAEQLLTSEGERLPELTVVFPNRRSGLFFTQALAEATRTSRTAVVAPQVCTIESFMGTLTDRSVPDALTLLFELYDVYLDHLPAQRAESASFDRFQFWGELMLKDFAELDTYLVPAEKIFADLRDRKAVDAAFMGLEPEQVEVLREFWAHFHPRTTEQQRYFLQLWTALPAIYTDFNARLAARGEAYSGRVFRLAAEAIAAGQYPDGPVVFAGFNDLNPSEQMVIKGLVAKSQARVFWDGDARYLTPHHEAGLFLRQWQRDPVLGPTLPNPFPAHFAEPAARQVTVVGVPLDVGQARVLGQQLAELAAQPGFDPSRTAVVLPDEALLFPVLHALPASIDSVNITMGYPFRHTPLHGLTRLLAEWWQTARHEDATTLFARPVWVRLLRHPYLLGRWPRLVQALLPLFEGDQRPYLRAGYLGQELDKAVAHAAPQAADTVRAVWQWLSQPLADPADAFARLFAAIRYLGTWLTDDATPATLEGECLFQLFVRLQRLEAILQARTSPASLAVFWRVFRQLTDNLRVPFAGEPIRGLQVMGTLETRNLDFDNVFVLSANEGTFPTLARTDSFVPNALRAAFKLTLPAEVSARQAFYFYRLLQRASRVYLLYNTESEGDRNGEPSRWIAQLRYEPLARWEEKILTHQPRPIAPGAIAVEKDEAVQQCLLGFCADTPASGELTPSSLNTFLECHLRFYFRYVARLKASRLDDTALTPLHVGNLLHDTLEDLYKNLLAEKQRRGQAPTIVRADFDTLRAHVPRAVEWAFRKSFEQEGSGRFSFEGQHLVVRSTMEKYARQVLAHDQAYAGEAGFSIVSLEQSATYQTTMAIAVGGTLRQVRIGGLIDRVDEQLGGRVRVLDYKTGRDSRRFADLPSLFDPTSKERNKAAFQVLFYSYLFAVCRPEAAADKPVQPSLYNARQMFESNFSPCLQMNKAELTDFRPLHVEWETHLRATLTALFDPAQPFVQTPHVEKCTHCDFAGICQRS